MTDDKSTGGAKPAFNVVVPFNGTWTVQMNRLFVASLSEFLDEFEDIDPELKALRTALMKNERCAWLSKDGSCEFEIGRLGGVTTLTSNEQVRNSLKTLIFDETQSSGNVNSYVAALGKALHNPYKASDIRRDKVRQRQGVGVGDDGDDSGGSWVR